MIDEAMLEQVAAGLGQLALFLRTGQWREAEALGLTPSQLQALALLHRRGEQRVQQIARLLGVTQPSATDTLAALVAKDLVRKHPDPHDRRAVLVALTGQGTAIAADRDEPPPALVAALKQLEPADLAALQRALVSLIRGLQVAGAIEPQRLCVTCRYFRPNVHPDAAAPHHCAFVDAPFGDAALRVDCGDHDEADAAGQADLWRRFAPAAPAASADDPPAATDEAP